ncbi:MAG: nucleotidyltransferase family protein [Clostridia bacterium]|nr:nucleotidyltransferase family protein [Clostridia bacterium]
MSTESRYFLSLVRSALCDEAPENAPQGVNFNTILKLSYYHNLIELVSYAIPKVVPCVPEEIASSFDRLKRAGIAREVNQDIELELLLTKFREAKIDIMLLKGTIIKHLYRLPDMRSMCDLDMLIKYEDLDKIDALMRELGYIERVDSDHDVSYRKPPYLNIELHYSITQADFGKRAHEYFKDAWSLAKLREGEECVYEQSREDFYVHHIDHMSKHYATGGCGVRPFCDIYIYLEKYGKELDWSYINATLEKIGLYKFGEHMKSLAYKWFGDGAGDEMSEQIEGYILSGGSFGTKERGALSIIARKGTKNKRVSRFKLIWYKLFLPYRHMCVVYPSLKKVPFLLPFYWVHRIFRTLLFRRGRLKENLQVGEREGAVMELANHLESVGLTDF